ncbi:hypothetical protein BJ875DRAFT_483182 [Amylocarpus encephaloides]|uniref:Uncharacterized protein n=1 Tax=Amylocarpus encephaloides TaxID=45428 RepID=A0A9P8C6P1_9HELO|nr:hypothetical protein BJ875DRAFT_483182 [Amylocarpus encephaloides]
MGDYALILGRAKSFILDYVKESKGVVVARCVNPGQVDTAGRMSMEKAAFMTVIRTVVGFGKVEVSEIATTLINEAVNGIEKETTVE